MNSRSFYSRKLALLTEIKSRLGLADEVFRELCALEDTMVDGDSYTEYEELGNDMSAVAASLDGHIASTEVMVASQVRADRTTASEVMAIYAAGMR